jgi:hypothetical protein
MTARPGCCGEQRRPAKPNDAFAASRARHRVRHTRSCIEPSSQAAVVLGCARGNGRAARRARHEVPRSRAMRLCSRASPARARDCDVKWTRFNDGEARLLRRTAPPRETQRRVRRKSRTSRSARSQVLNWAELQAAGWVSSPDHAAMRGAEQRRAQPSQKRGQSSAIEERPHR